MDAVAHLRVLIRNVLRPEAAVDRLPGLASIVRAEGARGGDGNEDALRICGIDEDGVETHAAGARLPGRARAMVAQAGELAPGVAAILGVKERCVLRTGVKCLRAGERWLQVPDTLELPRVRRAVVPLVRSGDAVVEEFVADRVPGKTTVIRPLHHLPKPARGL